MVTGVIQDAIRNQETLRIWYDPGERIIEPHVLGYSKDRNLLLRAFQVDGASETDEPFGWKLFRIDRMEQARNGGGSFDGPRPQYNPDDRAMKGGIIARL